MAAQDTGIVTPEAVRLDFQGASLGSRTLALLLDLTIQFTALVLILMLGAGLTGAFGEALPEWLPIVAGLLLTFALIWGYPVAFETLWRGRTPGKAALGLRVVTREGGPVRFRHAAIRAALQLVDVYATSGAVGVISVLASPRQQRLGDLVAGTLVLRERTAGGDVAPARFDVPQGAEPYARTIDVAALQPEDYATVRAFLLRAGSLDPQARPRLAAALANRMAERTAHAPPAGVSPELFLHLVAARYQQRSQDAHDRHPPVRQEPAPPPTAAAPEPSVPSPVPPSGFLPPS